MEGFKSYDTVQENYNDNMEEEFSDASDEFPVEEPDQSTVSTSNSESIGDVLVLVNSSTEVSSPALPRHRRLSSIRLGQDVPGNDLDESNCGSSVSFGINYANSTSSRNYKRLEFSQSLKQNGNENERMQSGDAKFMWEDDNKKVMPEIDGNKRSTAVGSSAGGETDQLSSNLLFSLTGTLVKVLRLQIKLFISVLMLPTQATSFLCSFIFDSVGTLMRLLHDISAKFVIKCLKEHKSVWKAALKFSRVLFSSCYVCFVLTILLVSAFVMGGIVTRSLIGEPPIHMKEDLNFDYTESRPSAVVPIRACPSLAYDMDCKKKFQVGNFQKSRVIPSNYKLRPSISLVLPESDYNRNLGIFQVRVDFLSIHGKVLASSRRPCMLIFKSQPIRLILVLLKAAPLITGYALESQDLKINFDGYTEGEFPVSYLKVTIEQRAEFKSGAGIPEIYSASLHLESELPILKRYLWYWKKSIFVWISLSVLIIEYFFLLLCCQQIFIPRVRLSEGSAVGRTPGRST